MIPMRSDPRDGMRELQRKADRICCLILNPEYPLINIDLERQALREECARLFPESLWLYDLIYESRFDRFIEQWRAEVDGDPWGLRP